MTSQQLRAIADTLEAHEAAATEAHGKIIVTWPGGWKLTYDPKPCGHNTRLVGCGRSVTTGNHTLIDAIKWAGDKMAGI